MKGSAGRLTEPDFWQAGSGLGRGAAIDPARTCHFAPVILEAIATHPIRCAAGRLSFYLRHGAPAGIRFLILT